MRGGYVGELMSVTWQAHLHVQVTRWNDTSIDDTTHNATHLLLDSLLVGLLSLLSLNAAPMLETKPVVIYIRGKSIITGKR